MWFNLYCTYRSQYFIIILIIWHNMFVKCVNTAKPEIIPAPVTPPAQTYSADSTVLVGKVSRESA